MPFRCLGEPPRAHCVVLRMVSTFLQQSKAGHGSFWKHNPPMPPCQGQSTDGADVGHYFCRWITYSLKYDETLPALRQSPYSERLAKQLFPDHHNHQSADGSWWFFLFWGMYGAVSASKWSAEALHSFSLTLDSLEKVGATRCFRSSSWGFLRLSEDSHSLCSWSNACRGLGREEGSSSWALPCRCDSDLTLAARMCPCLSWCWGWGAPSIRPPP